ncbi:hypothetical protein [Actinospongicola halichondriae]|uniref:hypothetical protein n=1 Tax=Actinospongicola halichondriae TaxID=3236844 RepID=UPI003D44A017
MNRRIVAAALAATVVGGAVTVFIPQHATSVVRLLAVSVAVVAGALVLAAVGPVVAREPDTSELDHLPAVGAKPLDPHGLRDARRDLDRPAAPGSLPPAVRDRLVEALTTRGRHDVLPPAVSVATSSAPVRDPSNAAAIVHRILDDVEQGAPHGHH